MVCLPVDRNKQYKMHYLPQLSAVLVLGFVPKEGNLTRNYLLKRKHKEYVLINIVPTILNFQKIHTLFTSCSTKYPGISP